MTHKILYVLFLYVLITSKALLIPNQIIVNLPDAKTKGKKNEISKGQLYPSSQKA